MTRRKETDEEVEARPVVGLRMDQIVVAQARANTENLARLVENLLRKHNKDVLLGRAEVKKKREQIEQRLKELQLEWFRIELRRARESGDQDAVEHYERLLAQDVNKKAEASRA